MAEAKNGTSLEERGGIFWSKGKKLVSSEPPEGLADVRIIRTRTPGGVLCEKGWLTFRIEPVRRRVPCSDGATREVQSFRVHKPNGDQCELLVCGVCGDMCWGDMADVLEAAVEGCRCCGAGLAVPGCITPHTFGSCFRCPESPELFMPQGGLVNARLQSEAANNAGPSANEQRSCLDAGRAVH